MRLKWKCNIFMMEKAGRLASLFQSIFGNKMSHLVGRDHEGKADWDPSKYRGMYKDLKVDVKKESAALRNEWTRE